MAGSLLAIVAVVGGLTAFEGGASADTGREEAHEFVKQHLATLERSDFQRELLDDGELTDDEYDRAFHAYTGCIAEAGAVLQPGSDVKNARGIYPAAVSVVALANGEPNWGGRAAVEECRRLYWSHVYQVRTLDKGPTRDEARVYLEAIGECVRAHGVDTGSTMEHFTTRLLAAATTDESHGIGEREEMVFRDCAFDLADEHSFAKGAVPMPYRPELLEPDDE